MRQLRDIYFYNDLDFNVYRRAHFHVHVCYPDAVIGATWTEASICAIHRKQPSSNPASEPNHSEEDALELIRTHNTIEQYRSVALCPGSDISIGGDGIGLFWLDSGLLQAYREATRSEAIVDIAHSLCAASSHLRQTKSLDKISGFAFDMIYTRRDILWQGPAISAKDSPDTILTHLILLIVLHSFEDDYIVSQLSEEEGMLLKESMNLPALLLFLHLEHMRHVEHPNFPSDGYQQFLRRMRAFEYGGRGELMCLREADTAAILESTQHARQQVDRLEDERERRLFQLLFARLDVLLAHVSNLPGYAEGSLLLNESYPSYAAKYDGKSDDESSLMSSLMYVDGITKIDEYLAGVGYEKVEEREYRKENHTVYLNYVKPCNVIQSEDNGVGRKSINLI